MKGLHWLIYSSCAFCAVVLFVSGFSSGVPLVAMTTPFLRSRWKRRLSFQNEKSSRAGQISANWQSSTNNVTQISKKSRHPLMDENIPHRFGSK